jgi:ribose 5-phosphate isomerase B
LKIYVSSDHAGLELRKVLVGHARRRGIVVEDLGSATDEPRDYPDEAVRVCRRVEAEDGSRGLLICGSGVGMCIAANKVAGIRAVDAWSVESARLSRAHNDTNVLCLGARLIGPEDASAIMDVWLDTAFDGGRHAVRVARLHDIEMATKGERR